MTERAAELLAVARAAQAAHKYHAALDLYRALHELEKDNTEVLSAIIDLASQVGDKEEVLRARVELINHHVCTNNLDAAEGLVDEVLKLDPAHELASRIRDFLEHRKNPALAFTPGPQPLISVPSSVPRGTVDFSEGIPPSVTDASLGITEPNPFSDVKTRQAPAEVMRALRHEHRLRRGVTEYPRIDDEWAARTTAAIDADNLRKLLRREAVTRVATHPGKNDFAAPNPTVALSAEAPAVLFASLRGTSPLLDALSPLGCSLLFDHAEVVHCFAGQRVMEQNAPGSSLFFVLAGEALLERRVVGSEPEVVESATAGDFFGEGALIGGSPRLATARLACDALLLEIGRPTLRKLSENHPALLPVLGGCLRTRLFEAFLNESPIAEAMSPAKVDALAAIVFLQKIRPGQTVARRGQAFTGFSTVMAGALRPSDPASPLLGPGAHFGGGALSSETSRETLTALTPTWLFHIPTPGLRRLQSF